MGIIVGIGSFGIKISRRIFLERNVPLNGSWFFKDKRTPKCILVSSDDGLIHWQEKRLTFSFRNIENICDGIERLVEMEREEVETVEIVMIHSCTGISGPSVGLAIAKRLNRLDLVRVCCIASLPLHIGFGLNAQEQIISCLDDIVPLVNGVILVDNHQLLSELKKMDIINAEIARVFSLLFSNKVDLEGQVALVVVGGANTAIPRGTLGGFISDRIQLFDSRNVPEKKFLLIPALKDSMVITGDAVHQCLTFWTNGV